jgi:hypothetical protein
LQWRMLALYTCIGKSSPSRQSGFFDMASCSLCSRYAIRPVKRTSSTVAHVYVSTEIISVISTDFSLPPETGWGLAVPPFQMVKHGTRTATVAQLRLAGLCIYLTAFFI